MSLLFGLSIAMGIALPPTTLPTQAPVHQFKVNGDHFELDGKPFVIRSGEMHYPRVPRQYWRDRFRKAKAMGLNTICTYAFWNLHEPKKGHFVFSGNLDLAEYLKIAKEEGIYIILRPGPYICTELDFGGLPAWLQKDRTMKVRSKDPKFLAATQAYFNEVGKVAKPYLLENGGPVIMTQVENEYGSYGSDHVYMAAIRDGLIKAGFKGQLCTSDGPGQDMLSGGTLPGIPASVNFGGGGPSAIAELLKFRPGAPKMVGEYWCGWFDHWGERHHTTGVAGHNADLEWFIKNGVSFNLYMFHGGTSSDFMPGANGDRNSYQPDITSYDYDSPLDESGRVTAKYMAFRNTIATVTGEKLPPIPSTPAPITIPRFALKSNVILQACAGAIVQSKQPKTFEDLGQNYGFVVYQTQIKSSGTKTLQFDGLHDYGIVFLNGREIGRLDRRLQQKSIEITGSGSLEIVVEAHARINFGHQLESEREGIVGPVKLDGVELTDWVQRCYPLDTPPVAGPMGGEYIPRAPYVYEGNFKIRQAGDTFLDMSAWTKGYVWVNGHNLGRYWNIGPQQALFIPGVWLKNGANSIVVIDEGPLQKAATLQGIAHPILDTRPAGTTKLLRKAGQTVTVDALTPTKTGAFAPGAAWQEVPLGVEGRYIALQALSEHGAGPFAGGAEIEVIGADGKKIDNVRVAYADSEELESENNSALNLVDHQPDTFWHTQWGDAQPGMPHLVVLDLGKSQQIVRLRYQPRQSGPNGRIKDYRLFVSGTPFPGL